MGACRVVQGVRTVDIVAVTEVRTLTIPREAFHWLIQGTDVLERMRHLSEMRKNKAWGVINKNTVLRQLTSAQKTQLEEYVHRRVYLEGEVRVGAVCCGCPHLWLALTVVVASLWCVHAVHLARTRANSGRCAGR